MKIRLETSDGGLVKEAEIAPFQEGPDVITWGARCFALIGAEQQGSDQANRITIYREVFCYALVVA